jgi:hypothetical protein
MRAVLPDAEEHVDVAGVIGYEVFGAGGPTVLLMPSWTIVHVRFWKVSLSAGSKWALRSLAEHPERFLPRCSSARRCPSRHPAGRGSTCSTTSTTRSSSPQGWAKYNRSHWQRDWPDFLSFFFGECFPETHDPTARR